MGADLFDRFPDWTSEADRILGYSIRQLCLEDPRGELMLTQFTQPALYVTNALTWRARVEDGKPAPAFVAGHSLGEYNALLAAGVFDFAQWLLEGTSGPASGGWDKAAMLAKVATKERTDIRVARPVPVIWTYMTGWTSGDGVTHFRNDVYGYDAPAAMQARADRALARR